MKPVEVIRETIEHCRRRKDGRGRWRAELACEADLWALGTKRSIAENCAAAARRMGAWLHTKGNT